MRVCADEVAEFVEPPLERVVKTLLPGQPLAEALEARLEPLDDGKLRIDGEPEGADFRGLGGGDVLVELLTGEHAETVSGGKKRGRGVGRRR